MVTLLTPSVWSAARFVDSGAPAARVVVLPHGYDPLIFKPGAPQERAELRKRLGFSNVDIVFLSVGHMRWKKGVDTLLLAVLAAAKQLKGDGECLRLVLKGVDALYNVSGGIEALLDGAGPLARKSARALFASGRLILDVRGDTVAQAALADLYRAADVAVSPYRAEGFNLPVLEAAASGLPLIITAGGATDDFTHESFARRVRGVFVKGGPTGASPFARHVEPDLGDLTDALVDAVRDKEWRMRAGKAAVEWVRANNLTWEGVARRHAELLFGGEREEEGGGGNMRGVRGGDKIDL